jgi:hypothetical protein
MQVAQGCAQTEHVSEGLSVVQQTVSSLARHASNDQVPCSMFTVQQTSINVEPSVRTSGGDKCRSAQVEKKATETRTPPSGGRADDSGTGRSRARAGSTRGSQVKSEGNGYLENERTEEKQMARSSSRSRPHGIFIHTAEDRPVSLSPLPSSLSP